MRTVMERFKKNMIPDGSGMELVQVAILIAIAIVIGLIFNRQISTFVTRVFRDLMNAGF